jgi:hypothetical protein
VPCRSRSTHGHLTLTPGFVFRLAYRLGRPPSAATPRAVLSPGSGPPASSSRSAPIVPNTVCPSRAGSACRSGGSDQPCTSERACVAPRSPRGGSAPLLVDAHGTSAL